MIKRVIKEYSILTFGAVLAATAMYFFMLPSNLAIGSSAALAMVLSNVIPLPVSLMSLIINVFLLICGFLQNGVHVHRNAALPWYLGVDLSQ